MVITGIHKPVVFINPETYEHKNYYSNFITLHLNFLTQINVSCFLFILSTCKQEAFILAIFRSLFSPCSVKYALAEVIRKSFLRYYYNTVFNQVILLNIFYPSPKIAGLFK